MKNPNNVLIKLNEEQSKIVKEALTIYPHVNKRSFYRACMVEGAQAIIKARKDLCPIPMEDLFRLELQTEEPEEIPNGRGTKTAVKKRRPKQLDLVRASEGKKQ